MADLPDLTVNMVAQRVDGVWTFQALPDGVHQHDQRLTLGVGPSGAGMMFPLALLDQFAAGVGND